MAAAGIIAAEATKLKVFNNTPLAIQVTRSVPGASPVLVAAYSEAPFSAAVGETLLCVEPVSGASANFTVESGQENLTLTPLHLSIMGASLFSLIGRVFGMPLTLTVFNATLSYVDVCSVAPGQQERERAQHLAPGMSATFSPVLGGEVWTFRTGVDELLNVYIVEPPRIQYASPEQVVRDGALNRYFNLQQVNVPALAPVAVLPSGVQPVLLEEKHKPIKTYEENFIEVTERPGATPQIRAVGPSNTEQKIARFNTLDNATTRELTISGVEVRLDGSSKKLGPLEGKPISDLTSVTIYADHLVIGKPLQWQGTDVRIYARKLTFREKGCIDTSPQEWVSQAFSSLQRRGRPIDAQGKYTDRGANGQPGQRAGDVYLFVNELDLGAQDIKRFVCKGSDGQMGEPGGLKLPEKSDGAPLDPKDLPKNKQPVTLQDIRNIIENAGYSTRDLNKLHVWRYPNDSGGYTNNFNELQGRQKFDANVVTDLRIVLFYLVFLEPRRGTVHLPGSKSDVATGRQTWTALQGGAKDRVLPGNGEDAYPSGATGKGGDGGSVYIRAELSGRSANALQSAGGQSNLSQKVEGGNPGTPNQALYADLILFQEIPDSILAKTGAPTIAFSPQHVARRGNAASGTAQGAGRPGSVKSEYLNRGVSTKVGPNDWLHGEMLRKVLSFVEAAYRRGFRVQAMELLAPYLEAFAGAAQAKLPADVSSCRSTMFALRRNLITDDLDLYSHPPGWVPRFSAQTYLQLYDVDRGFSYKFCYIMTKLLEVMDSVENAGQVLEIAADQAEEAIKTFHEELGAGYKKYADTRDKMDEACDIYRGVVAKVKQIETEAQTLAELGEKEKAIAKAFLYGIGAVVKAIPLYKPAFQIAGELLTKAGDAVDTIDPSESDTGVNVLNFIEGFSKNAAQALEDNADTYKDQFDQTLKEKYKTNPAKDDLQTKINKATNEVKEIEKGAATQFAREAKSEELTKALAPADAVITSLASRNPELKRQLAEYDNQIKAADETGSSSELAVKARQMMVARRLKVSTALALNSEQIARLRQKQKTLARTLQGKPVSGSEDTEVLDSEKSQATLEKAQEGLDKLLGEKKDADATAKIEQVNKTFGNVLDGAQSLLTGMSKVSNSINRLKKLNDPNAEPDAQVTKLRDLYLKRGSIFKDRYDKIMKEVAEAEKKKATAVQDFQGCYDFILKKTGDLSQALQTRVEVARNRMTIALSIDASLKASIRDMQHSAEERMEYYLYLFRKAYMYEQLVPVSEDMANINQLVKQMDDQLDKLDKVKTVGGEQLTKKLTVISGLAGSEFGRLGNMALTNTLANLGKQILERRSAKGAAKTVSYAGLGLPEQALQSLERLGTYTFPGVNTLLRDSSSDVNSPPPISLEDITAKHMRVVITNITLGDGDVEFDCDEKFSGPVGIEMQFGRQFVLRASEKTYYMFRISDWEEPISYVFTVKNLKKRADSADVRVKTGTVEAAKVELMDEVFKAVLNNLNQARGQGASEIAYKEMSPSLYSSLTITVGANQRVKIRKLSPSIELRYEGENRR
jgi:hypothetical protein